MEILPGLEMEAEEAGMVALIGLVLMPGVMWIAKGKTTGSMIFRGAVVAALVGTAVAVEAALDRTADKVADAVTGEA